MIYMINSRTLDSPPGLTHAGIFYLPQVSFREAHISALSSAFIIFSGAFLYLKVSLIKSPPLCRTA